MKKLLLITISLLFSANAFALNNYFCNTTNQYVNLGNTKEQVIAACGQPADKAKGRGNAATATDQIWIYGRANSMAPGAVSAPGYNNYPTSPSDGSYYQQQQRPSYYDHHQNTDAFAITIENGKVAKMQGSGNQYCRGWSPYYNAPAQMILQHCGRPAMVKPLGPSNKQFQQPDIENWLYKNPYGPPVILQFVNDKLVSIVQGKSQY